MHYFFSAITAVFLATILVSAAAGPARAETCDIVEPLSALKNRDYDKAIRLYTSVIESGCLSGHKLATTYKFRGDAHAAKRQYDRAIENYNEAMEIDPNYAPPYNNRGNVYAVKGQHDKAIADYTRGIAIMPSNAIIYYNRGNAYAARRQYDKAIADYNKSIEIKPDYVKAYANRGAAYENSGKRHRAIADYNRAIMLKPGYQVAVAGLKRLGATQSATRPARRVTKPPAKTTTAKTRKTGSVFRDCGTCPVMVSIPAGSFMMGAPSGEANRDNDEDPRHQVRIAHPFALGKYEVTVAEFAAFVKESGHDAGTRCSTSENGGYVVNRVGRNWRNPGFSQTSRHPVTCVSWLDAKAYVDWLSRKTGKHYRLPSESEWEYAARAGTTTARHWGDGIGRNNANCNGCGSRWDNKQTAPVGSFRPNRFGLHDMLGNLVELVEDCYSKSYSGAPSDGRAWTSGNCRTRIGRGGSWNVYPKFVRLAARYRNGAGDRLQIYGFRVAKAF